MANAEVETVGSGAEKVKLALVACLLVAAVVAFYMLSKQGQLVQWGALLVGVIVASFVLFATQAGKDLIGFGRDSTREVRKVVWPSRKEATQMTLYVFGFVVLMALFLWGTDKTIEWVIFDLLLGWRK